MTEKNEADKAPKKKEVDRAAQKKLERILYILVGVLVVARLAGAYIDQQQRHHGIELAVQKAPDFTWRDFNSDKHTLKELTGSGKVIVLHFWATWCGPCRVEFPALLRAAKIMEKDVIFLTISGDDDDAPVRKYLAAAKDAAGVKPDNMLYGFDPMKVIIGDLFQTTAFPETYIIDPQMNMRRKFKGGVDWSSLEIINYITDLKSSPAVKTSAVPVPQ